MEQLTVNYLRVTSVNMITGAKSGHPGICLGAMPILYTIYKNANFNPQDPRWINRDRIVLSAGHGSAMLYSMLNLYGFDLDTEQLKNFRKLGSKTPGHPEYGLTDGVDSSTGPLGQGIANAVGMALAEKHLAATFNKPNCEVVNHYTYALCGDGCLMEGVAQEAISLAGKMQLNKLILFFDSNDITIEGNSTLANVENHKQKFESMHWNVLQVDDANNLIALQKALEQAKQSKDKPTVVIVRSHIGFASELQDNAKCHGTPFSQEQVDKIKQTLNYTYDDYVVPQNVQKLVAKQLKAKQKVYDAYTKTLAKFDKKHNDDYVKFNSYLTQRPVDLVSIAKQNSKDWSNPISTRELGGKVLNKLYVFNSNMFGGSADVSSSTKQIIQEEGALKHFSAQNPVGKNVYFGIREHAMASILNGIMLHGGLRAFCSTYLAFLNYMSPGVRMASLMSLPVMYVFTHDSIGAGEDGPTHQPTEQLATLRAMPNLNVYRPCNYLEVAQSYQVAANATNPTAIILTRQTISQPKVTAQNIDKGAYVLSKKPNAQVTLVGCGSEVEILLQAQSLLEKSKINANVVSMLCEEEFAKQPVSYQNKTINPNTLVVTMEASSDNMWFKYATNRDCAIRLNEFGASGNYKEVFNHFNFTAQKVVEVVKSNLKKHKK